MALLLCTILVITYKNKIQHNKATPDRKPPTQPGTVGYLLEVHGREKVSHINFATSP